MHLLISVFVTPLGLYSHRNEKVTSDDSNFRIDRFLTSCFTLQQVEWESVRIYLKVDSCWSELESNIHFALKQMFPACKIVNNRLETRHDWETAAAFYQPTDVILLQANDDHALVCQKIQILEELAEIMAREPRYGLAGITHFTEMQALISKSRESRILAAQNIWAIPMHYAIGTQLVVGALFQSWWAPGVISDSTKIVRPDNPFGQSVTFKPTLMLVANIELFRHLDGYSHLALQRPLAPLRNLVKLNQFEHGAPMKASWTIKKWPLPILGFSGRGSDLHDVCQSSPNIFGQMRVNVALLQSFWGLKFAPDRMWEILNHTGHQNRLIKIASGMLAGLSFPVFRNVPDWILDGCWLAFRRVLFFLRLKQPKLPSRVYYQGWIRSLYLPLRKSRKMF